MTPKGLHRFIVFTTACTVALLVAGALVTSNDAGASVPDWPLSYGSLVPPWIGGIRWEYGHRVVAGFVSLLTLVLALWTWRREPRRWVRRLALGALALIVLQALLGGLTVLFDLPPAVSAAHATLAQLFFCAVVSLALFTGSWWQGALPKLEETETPSVRTLGVATSGVILLQLILGAAFRHNGVGLLPHLVGAAAVTAMILWLTQAILRRHGAVPALRRGARSVQALLGIQLLLGVAADWVLWANRNAPQPEPLYVVVTVAHVVVGAFTLAAAVLLTLACYRLVVQVRPVPLASGQTRAAL
jgi:cytochrome c oxidase assembly protein subunit 15